MLTQSACTGVAQHLQWRHFILGLLAFFFTFQVVHSQPMGSEKTQAVAAKFYTSRPAHAGNRASLTVVRHYVKNQDTLMSAYEYDRETTVLVANEARELPILGYFDSSKSDQMVWIDPVEAYINDFLAPLAYIRANGVNQLDANDAWRHWLSDWPTSYKSTVITVGPLLSTNWGQDNPYNLQCPTISGQSALTGCVATAMAQIMRYHEHPYRGQGNEPAYIGADGVSVPFVNFATQTYLFNQMPISVTNATTAQQQEIAKLNFHCGAGANANYGLASTGAVSNTARTAMNSHFRYTSAALTAMSLQPMISAIDASKPIYCRGVDASEGGHAWVCDGYQNDNGTTLLHMNWGWHGDFNAYFAISLLNPTTFDFETSKQYFVPTPQTSGAPVNVIASNGTVSNAVQVTWNSVSGAVYRVFRSTTNNSTTASAIGSGWQTGTSFTDNTAVVGTTYNYWVKSCFNMAGNYPSAFSMSDPGFAGGTGGTCNAPSSLTANGVGQNSATLTWVGSSNWSSFKLQYSTNNSTWTTLNNLSSVSYSLTSLLASTTYYVKVMQNCSGGTTSSWSSTITFTTSAQAGCSAPTGLTVSSVSQTSAVLSWSGSTDWTSFTLRYGTDGVSWSQITGVSSSTYTLSGLSQGTNYVVQESW